MSNKHSAITSINRRDFLKKTSGLAFVGMSASLLSDTLHAATVNAKSSYHHDHSADEKFWDKISKEFILDKNTVYMNTGTTGSMPKSVLKSYNSNNSIVASNPWDMQHKFGSWPYVTEMVSDIAPGFGADANEIVLCRNTTDGMCTILNGLHFEEGDVILTTHHEHVAAVSPFDVISKRFAVEVVFLEIPVYTGDTPISAQDFIDVFQHAVAEYGDRVRLIAFSHITYKTGTTLPAKRICQEVAIPNNIPTLIDGAHTIGMLDLDFHDIGCDFYSGSGHKWQCGAGATGILYVRDNASRLDEYWADRENPLWFINSSLSHASYLGTQLQLQYIGNDNYPAKKALADACLLWDEIGRDKIEARVLSLSHLCKAQLRLVFPSATLYAPSTAELSSAISSFNPFADQHDEQLLTLLRDRLRDEYGYIIRTTSFKIKLEDVSDTYALRISTHLFNSKEEVIGLVNAMHTIYVSLV